MLVGASSLRPHMTGFWEGQSRSLGFLYKDTNSLVASHKLHIHM